LRAGLLAGAGVLAAPLIDRRRHSLFAEERTGTPVPPVSPSERALAIVQRSTVIDMLGLLTLDWESLTRWQQEPARFGDAEIQKLRGSGVRVFHPAVDPNQPDARAATLDWISGWNRLLQAWPDRLLRIDGVTDLDRVRDEGKLGILIGFQNSDHFHTVADVGLFQRLGQRVSQLTYNARNRLGSGCQAAGGLTAYGLEIVTAMNAAGMAVDISHCNERTSLDAIAASRKPVLITHSNAQALAPHPRCKSDAVIRAMAARGGVMGITVVPAFVGKRLPVTLDDVLDHFDYVAKLVGVEHVGLGSDSDVDAIDPKTGRIRPRYDVRGLRQSRRTFDIAEGLLRRGYGDREVELILGGNFRRALAEIWNAAPEPVKAAG
jgi:membrane dipeptidase